jgi:hypothetical protein
MFAATHAVNPSEALTLEQAVTAYTRGSAFAEHQEQNKGTLAVGMLADLAVLSQDIFRVPVQTLPVTTSVLTIVGGRIVHEQYAKRFARRLFECPFPPIGKPAGTSVLNGCRRPAGRSEPDRSAPTPEPAKTL